MSEYSEWSDSELEDEISNAEGEVELIQERIIEMKMELEQRKKNEYLTEKEELKKK